MHTDDYVSACISYDLDKSVSLAHSQSLTAGHEGKLAYPHIKATFFA